MVSLAVSHFLTQTSCLEDLSPKVDVFAFGMVLWELFVNDNSLAMDSRLAARQYAASTRRSLVAGAKASAGSAADAPLTAHLFKRLGRLWQNPEPQMLVRAVPPRPA